MGIFFFNDTATTEIYTLSLHDALPIFYVVFHAVDFHPETDDLRLHELDAFLGSNYLVTYHTEPLPIVDRKSTRLNSSHANISYAVFCLKKKTKCILLESPLSGTTLNCL